MGPRATATGSSQAAYLAKPVGRDRRVVEKMTGITPVAFTCSREERSHWEHESSQ